MNCATCKLNKIGPNTAPYGGFLCVNEHLQCSDCNAKGSGHCGVCEAHTNFVQMNYNKNNTQQTAPTAPPLELTSKQSGPVTAAQADGMVAVPLNPFPKGIYEQLETQSSLSQEQLSMHDSHEVLSLGDGNGNSNEGGAQQPPLSPKVQEKKKQAAMAAPERTHEPMETIFVGQRTQPKSLSNFTLQQRQLEHGVAAAAQPKTVSSAPMTPPQKVSSSSSKRRSSEHRACRKYMLDYFDDPDIIHTSELRFIESSESLQNYYSGGTLHQPPAEGCHEGPQADGHAAAGSEAAAHKAALQESLSTKALHDFDSQNRAQPAELVENYLRSYHQAAICSYPAYPYQHHHPHQHQHGAACYHAHHCDLWHQRQMPMRSISVSTESDPKLLAAAMATPAALLGAIQRCAPPATANNNNNNSSKNCNTSNGKYLPQDFIVMHAGGVAHPLAVAPQNLLAAASTAPSPKTATPSIDIRMQKVLETFAEAPRHKPLSEKPLLIGTAKKLRQLPPASSSASDSAKSRAQGDGPSLLQAAVGAGAEAALDLDVEGGAAGGEGVPLDVDAAELEAGFTSDGTEKDLAALDLASRLSNSHRAYYNPPAAPVRLLLRGDVLSEENSGQSLPLPQFQLITCCTLMTNELIMARTRCLHPQPLPACQLNISRAPVQCPESACRRMIFVSDFNKHLIVDHGHLPMERIATRQYKNFFIDPRISHKGLSRCHMLYLIRDKISDLGSSKFKDFLPLLVMSTRINLSDLLGVPAAVLGDANIDFLMIWLTGIAPEEFPVSVSLTVWSRAGPTPVCHIVHSGQMYSIRKSPHHADICRSGQTMLLAASEVHLLTKGGRDMLELQLAVH